MRGYGSGSGFIIWERHKRNGMWLKTISKRTIRLRSGVRFEINATPHSFSLSSRLLQVTVAISPPAAKDTSNRSAVICVHLTGSPHSQMQDFKRGVKEDLYRRNRIFSQPENFISSYRKKVTTRQRVLLSSRLRNPAFAGVLPA